MKKKSYLSKFIVALVSTTLLVTTIPKEYAKADSYTVVTLGANLSQAQKDEMLKYFNVTKNDAQIIEIT